MKYYHMVCSIESLVTFWTGYTLHDLTTFMYGSRMFYNISLNRRTVGNY